MLPPGFDEAPARGRTVGSRGRPLALVIATVLFTVFWAGLTGTAFLGLAQDDRGGHAGDFAGVGVWVVVFALMTWRLWRGGTFVTALVAGAGRVFGALLLFVTVLSGVVFMDHFPDWSALYLLAGLIPSGSLLTAGILARRREVSRWGGS